LTHHGDRRSPRPTRQAPIALYIPRLEGGGAERAMVNIARGLAESGHAVDLVLVKAVGPYLDDVVPQVRVVELQSRGSIAGLPQLVSYLKRERPSALLSTLQHANIIAGCAKKLAGSDVRWLALEDNTLTASAVSEYPLKKRIAYHLMRWTYPWADVVVAHSNDTARDLIRHGAATRDNLRVVPYPLVTPELIEQSQQTPEHPWLQNKTTHVILGAGRLTPQKDFPTLIHAFQKVRQSLPCRLIILGEGDLRTKLETLVKSEGLESDVDLPGFVRNPLAYMAHSDAFVLSSRWEGFGIVLVEALTAGVPIVAANCPGGPREILKEGAYGRLVPVGDVDRMAKNIVEVLRQPPDRQAQRARAAAFEMGRITDQYRRLIFADGPLEPVQPALTPTAMPSAH